MYIGTDIVCYTHIVYVPPPPPLPSPSPPPPLPGCQCRGCGSRIPGQNAGHAETNGTSRNGCGMVGFMVLSLSLLSLPTHLYIMFCLCRVARYHSHPGFGCWLSGVDINTQQSFETLSARAVAVVVDPIQSVKGERGHCYMMLT